MSAPTKSTSPITPAAIESKDWMKASTPELVSGSEDKSSVLDACHDRDIRSPCTLFSDRVHMFAVRLLYVLPFPFPSICPVSPPIGEHVVRSVSLFDYLICFLSRFRLLYVPVPVPLLIRCLSVIRLSHLLYLLSVQRDCARHSLVIPTSRTSPLPFYLV